MNIQLISPQSLTPYKENAKKHPPEQIMNLKDSIQRYGFTQPIVAHEKQGKYIVLAGHGRLEAAKQLKLEEVPVVIVDGPLSQEQLDAYRILDNKLNESPWDLDILFIELGKIKEMDLPFYGLKIPEETDRNEDQNTLAEQLERFKTNPIKQLIFYLGESEYEFYSKILEDLQAQYGHESPSQTFAFLLSEYAKNKSEAA